MAVPSGSAVVKDNGNVPAPQFWDNVAGSYNYLFGNSTTGEFFSDHAAIVPATSGGYKANQTVKSGAGTFYGCHGTYKGAVAGWIMAFDASTAPATGATPLAVTAVGPIASGVDNNWSIVAAKPYRFTTGLYVALSTTGGTFTASALTNIAFTTEFV